LKRKNKKTTVLGARTQAHTARPEGGTKKKGGRPAEEKKKKFSIQEESVGRCGMLTTGGGPAKKGKMGITYKKKRKPQESDGPERFPSRNKGGK